MATMSQCTERRETELSEGLKWALASRPCAALARCVFALGCQRGWEKDKSQQWTSRTDDAQAIGTMLGLIYVVESEEIGRWTKT